MRMRSLATSYCDHCKNSFRGNYDHYPLCGDCDDLKKSKATIEAISELKKNKENIEVIPYPLQPNFDQITVKKEETLHRNEDNDVDTKILESKVKIEEMENEEVSDGKGEEKDTKEGQMEGEKKESLDTRLYRMMHGDDFPLFLQEFSVEWEAGKRKKGKEEPTVNSFTELKEEEVKEEFDKINELELDSGKFVKNEPKKDLTSQNGPMVSPNLSWKAKPPHRKNSITSKSPIDVIGVMNSVKACPREANAKSKEDRKQHTTEPKSQNFLCIVKSFPL